MFCSIYKSLVDWLIIKNKPEYTGISLNTKYKREVVEFIEKYLPQFKGYVR